jgi:hypothetical protein
MSPGASRSSGGEEAPAVGAPTTFPTRVRALPVVPVEPQHRNSIDLAGLLNRPTATPSATAAVTAATAHHGRGTGKKRRRVGGHLRRRSRFGLGPARPARSNSTHAMGQSDVSRPDDRARPRPFQRGFRRVSAEPESGTIPSPAGTNPLKKQAQPPCPPLGHFIYPLRALCNVRICLCLGPPATMGPIPPWVGGTPGTRVPVMIGLELGAGLCDAGAGDDRRGSGGAIRPRAVAGARSVPRARARGLSGRADAFSSPKVGGLELHLPERSPDVHSRPPQSRP